MVIMNSLNDWNDNPALCENQKCIERCRVLSVEQVEAILSAIDVSSPLGVRDRALFELFIHVDLG